MTGRVDLGDLEREVHRAYWSDGIIDIYIGVALLFIGAMWTWFSDLAALAGILPAVLVTPMLLAHQRYVEARLGHVEWRPARRSREHRSQLALLGIGVGLFVVAVGMYLLVDASGAASRAMAPGLMAWLLAVLMLGLAFLLDARRMLLYAAVLAVGGIVVVLLEADPGWPMLAGGFVAAIVGTVMLRRFSQRYPVIDPA